jgi:hypothetical protein
MTGNYPRAPFWGTLQGDGAIFELEDTALRGEPSQAAARGYRELSKTDHVATWGQQGLAGTQSMPNLEIEEEMSLRRGEPQRPGFA